MHIVLYRYASSESMSEKTVLITGGNRGRGFQAIFFFVKRNIEHGISLY